MSIHSLEAEASVLGACILDPSRIQEGAVMLTPEDFFLPAHQHVFRTLLLMHREKQAIDLLTISERLSNSHPVEAAGGVVFLSKLLDGIPRLTNVRHYADIVRRCSERRHLLALAQSLADEATEGRLPVDQIVTNAQLSLSNARRGASGSWTQVSSPLGGVLDTLEAQTSGAKQPEGVMSGLRDLDSVTGGWQRGDLIIVAGRPSSGKTALALNMAVNAAKEGQVVGVFSLEMTAESLARRLVFGEAGVNQQRARGGSLTEADFAKTVGAFSRIHKIPLFINEARGLTAGQVFTQMEALRAEAKGLGLVVIDYLGLLRSGQKHGNKVEELGEIARLCKMAAHYCDVPVILLCQLNRGLEGTDSKRPNLASLRGSGEIEEHADVVLMIHRPEYHLKREGKEVPKHLEGVAELILAKNRNGPVVDVKVMFDESKTTFRDVMRHRADTTSTVRGGYETEVVEW